MSPTPRDRSVEESGGLVDAVAVVGVDPGGVRVTLEPAHLAACVPSGELLGGLDGLRLAEAAVQLPERLGVADGPAGGFEIGRASCRERVLYTV